MSISRRRRVAAVCGIAGPLYYIALVTLLGFLEADYRPLAQSMSELGSPAAAHAALINCLGFPLLGISLMVFAAGLYTRLKAAWTARLAGGLIVLSGLCLLLLGVFPTDPGPVDLTRVGRLHRVLASLSALSFIMAQFLIALNLRNEPRRRAFAVFTLVLALAALALSLLFLLESVPGYLGLVQRVSLGFPLLWTMIASGRLLLPAESTAR